jgi:double-stranded uracil-DNA glycosylase
MRRVQRRNAVVVLPLLRDRIRPGVRVLFVGINPGVRSAQTGHHFAGFSNRFWKLLFESGLAPEPVTYLDDDRLSEWGYGITNVVARPTRGIDELRPEEYAAGRLRLRRKVRRYKPRVVAFVGITVYRAMFPEQKGPVNMGLQAQRMGESRIFVLPNTSGRNAHYSFARMLAAFASLRQDVERSRPGHATATQMSSEADVDSAKEFGYGIQDSGQQGAGNGDVGDRRRDRDGREDAR